MKIHEIFPILIAQDKVDNHDEFKENYYDDEYVNPLSKAPLISVAN